ncbi:MAG: MTH938/NDUFAF3 family protein [candidate division KSB1 bacterium]|nr:MTH938/NDUFAF3 family protein [candidate division KSB1 bacterium]MDZ7319395.1 MTH938/NDUFAF3 family protein [candidate division KSB1 bacterium]
MIDSYQFGRMVIDGVSYRSDLIICGQQVRSNWWRRVGHELCVADIEAEVAEFAPQVLIVGTGRFGLMKVLPETEAFLRSRAIQLIAEKTGVASTTYNHLIGSVKVMAAFHLTC